MSCARTIEIYREDEDFPIKTPLLLHAHVSSSPALPFFHNEDGVGGKVTSDLVLKTALLPTLARVKITLLLTTYYVRRALWANGNELARRYYLLLLHAYLHKATKLAKLLYLREYLTYS